MQWRLATIDAFDRNSHAISFTDYMRKFEVFINAAFIQFSK